MWLSITYYVRGEFYREKAKDYVAAALAVARRALWVWVSSSSPEKVAVSVARLAVRLAAVTGMVRLVHCSIINGAIEAMTMMTNALEAVVLTMLCEVSTK